MSFIKEIPNNLSQDESIEPEQVKKTKGNGKVYLPFCSFHNLESAQGHLAMTFADNEIPLERKRHPGRPKVTTITLTQSDSDDPPVQELISNKIRLEETPIVTPQPKVKKKRGRPAKK
ncbi:hypothetical protein BpHYR1_051577 [Brachionus plicatilis]|uniref:Uncharacterized protein n=1 Tax=Brachionus plicatilis TaxID=10195 RepID=A0A3M7PWK9_BRAPC|nr:hypothetical protein BpHYR1_051577 [Brachionus plicatilis]